MGLLSAYWKKHVLQFVRPSGTSRGVLTEKPSWFLCISDITQPEVIGTGECAPIAGLSIDDVSMIETKLDQVCEHLQQRKDIHTLELSGFPSIRFGLEMALLDLKTGGKKLLFPSAFTQGKKAIPINGLIWMGDIPYMQAQIDDKLNQGFRCLKIKIGAMNFDQEYTLLRSIRDQYPDIEIRVDANGAFSPKEALDKLECLAQLKLHSIEQPIRSGQLNEMAWLCEKSKLPIALDEELIGIHDIHAQYELLNTIRPQYIVIKPSLVGGFAAATQWIQVAQDLNIHYWITSALESNSGLNAIAQWCATMDNPMIQGLGTGQLYSNNFPSPLCIQHGFLYYIELRRNNEIYQIS
ncbi:MAG: o-succinylbenzoate synthase [Desulfobacterales bacterium]|nr:o-succinylbenzoate synthase [Desulfobacterales bacterium]